MKQFNKILSFLLAFSLVFQSMTVAFADTDMTAEEKAQVLYDLGLFSGISTTEFEPNLEGAANREQAMKMIAVALNWETEDTATSGFSDVSNWAQPYVAKAVEIGITNGIGKDANGNELFGAKNDVTARQLETWFDRVISGSTTAWQDNADLDNTDGITRGYLVQVTYGVLKQTPTGATESLIESIVSEDMELQKIAVEGGLIEPEDLNPNGNTHPGMNSGDNTSGMPNMPTAPTTDTDDDDTDEDDTDVDDTDEDDTDVDDTDEDDTDVDDTDEDDTDDDDSDEDEHEDDDDSDLSVESVEALNLKQIEIVFSKDIDDAGDEDNYDLDGDDAELDEDSLFELQDDDNTVIITLTEAADNQEYFDITISDIEAEDGDDLDEEEFEDLYFLDTDIPEVESIEAISDDTVEVTFSEPIAEISEDAFEFDDYKVDDITLSDDETVVQIELYSSMDDDEIDMDLVGDEIEDYAGYSPLDESFEFDFEEDDDEPEIVGYEDATTEGVTLIFDGDIEIEDDDVENFYHTNTSNYVVEDVEVDDNELTLVFYNSDDDHSLPEGYAYIYIEEDALSDLSGNTNDDIKYKIEVEEDEDEPTIDDIEVEDLDEIVITFSEDVDEDSAEDEDNYELYDEDGDEVEDAIDDITLSDDDEVTIEFEDDLDGEYTIVIDGVEDLAGNDMDDEEDFEVEDDTAPDFDDFYAVIYNAGEEDQMIVIYFGEEMATSGSYSIDDESKYTFGDQELEDLDEYDLEVIDDGEAIEITVPSSEDAEDDDDIDEYYDLDASEDIEMARVADADGNKTDDYSGTIDASNISESGNVSIDSVVLVSTDEIEITFTDELDDFEDDDIIVYADEDDSEDYDDDDDEELDVDDYDLELDDDGNTVLTITLDDDVSTDGYTLDSDGDKTDYKIRVTTLSSGIESANEYGDELEEDDDNEIEDEVEPELVGYYAVDDDGDDQIDMIIAEYTEDIDDDYLSKASYDVDGYDIDSIYVDDDDEYLVIIEIEESGDDDLDEEPDVTQENSIYDLSGNELEEQDEEEAMSADDDDNPYM